MPDIKHDAELTEIWVWERGERHRVYRGDTQEHIDWKLNHYRKHKHEIILVGNSDSPPAGDLTPA
jgi:hypothetical protein